MDPNFPEPDDLAILDTFEERADHIDETALLEGTATSDFFDTIHQALISRNLVLIVGPRGCGKTHTMRYTSLMCRDNKRLPLGIYVTFNRYYRLEPLLKSRVDAIELFHLWVLARIVAGLRETVAGLEVLASPDPLTQEQIEKRVAPLIGFETAKIREMLGRLERASSLTFDDEELARSLSTDSVASLIISLCDRYSRRHASLLLDDAALVLTPEYLNEFFDIVRVLKHSRIAPKASVYPGTTEYGPRFHAQHEGRRVEVWLSTEDANYRTVMDAIAQRRYPDGTAIPREVNDLFKYAAFGIPRAYLTMLREYRTGRFATSQQGINQIIEKHRDGRIEEYKSLTLKMPRLETVVRTGVKLFEGVVEALRQANVELAGRDEKQTIIGIPEADMSPLVARMLNLLVEAGLLYEHSKVSHGEDRTYRRYAPHMAALMAVRAFSGKRRGFSPKQVLDYLERRPSKHPTRRAISKLLSPDDISNLRLDLPACQRCGTARINETQKFCHNCGAELLDTSSFAQCMALSLSDVPGLTPWQREQLETIMIRTIGDLLAIQDPGTELRRIRWVGDVRAKRILERVTKFVDEFLS